MAGSVNKAIILGRLGRDPELRYTQGNTAVCNFTVATDETWKDQSGQPQSRTEWHRIVVWGRQAELVHRYLKKGRLAWVEGRIRHNEYVDREGQRRWATDIIAYNVRFLDKKDPESPQHPPDEAPPRQDRPAPPPDTAALAPHPPDTPSSPNAQEKLPGEEDVPF